MQIKKYLVLLICLVSQWVLAQGWLGKDLSNINVKELTAAQRDEVMREAKKQGLNEADMEALARSKGLNLADLKRINAEADERKGKPADTSQNKKSRVEENVLQSTVAIYGQELFENNQLGFAPSLNLAPTAGYILGPNDRISIRIYGLQEQKMEVVIGNNGAVVIPYGGKVMLSGLTLAEAERNLINQLKKHGFASLGTGESQLKIQITEFRTIQVMVWGAKQSGSYYLPSLGTAFHALFAAGGPGINRSYRNIHLIRNGKTIRVIDLYEFLSKGSRNSDITLQDNDILFIPYYERRVRLRGEVKTPAVYELLPNEHLLDAFQYAGGYTEIAYRDVVEVIRYGGEQREVFSVREDAMKDFQLSGSEIVTVSSILEIIKNRVQVTGAVERPGYYSMASGGDLKQAIENAGGLKPSAVKSYVLLYHNARSGNRSYISYRLDSVLSGKTLVSLEEDDVVYVGDSVQMNVKEQVFVFGDVIKQGSFEYGEGLTVSRLLFLAGGFEQEALTSKIIISRKVEDESQLATVITMSARRDFWNDVELSRYVLMPGDVISVSRNPYFRNQVYVSCEGEFKVPGVYPMSSRKQTLFDIYTLAGGVTLFGNLSGSLIIRTRKIESAELISATQKKKISNELYKDDGSAEKKNASLSTDSVQFDTIVIGSNTQKFESVAKAFYLKPGDRFIIPILESTVRISGEVYNPNLIMYDRKLNVKQYISLAGGASELAYKRGIFVIYQNGRSAKSRKILGIIPRYPTVHPGCEIVIPTKLDNEDKNSKLSTTERVALISVMTSAMSSLGFVISQVLK
jgi:protein involved in polysaccharide export with SLBB domain